jgi:hypothetical protein
LPCTTYLPNWHIDAFVPELMRVRAGDVLAVTWIEAWRAASATCKDIVRQV